MEDIVSCKSCKHVRYDWKNFPFNIGSIYAWNCNRVTSKEEVEFDPVNGKELVKPSARKICMSARSEYGECKPEGKFWEPKHKKDLFKYLKRVGNV